VESGVGPLLLSSSPGLEVHGRPHFTRHVVSLARATSLTSGALSTPSPSYRSSHPEPRNRLEEQTAPGIVVCCKHAALPRKMSISLSKWMEEMARQSGSESTTGATDQIEQTARTNAATRTPQASFLLTSTTSTALYD